MNVDVNTLKVKPALRSLEIATDTATNGIIIDTNGAVDVNLILQFHDYTDGTYTPVIETGDDSGLSDASNIADAYVSGNGYNTAITGADDKCYSFHIDRSMHKRYVRLKVTSASTSSGSFVSAIAVLGALSQSQPSSKNPS